MKIENQDYAAGSNNAVDYLLVNEFSGGIVGLSQRMLGSLKNGGTLKTGTPPGCWGPMITPAFQGVHEVTLPVFIEGTEVGDAVALKIKKMKVTLIATSSGVMSFVEGRYHSDPFVVKYCNACGTEKAVRDGQGIGGEDIRRKNRDTEARIMQKDGKLLIIESGLIIIDTVSHHFLPEIAFFGLVQGNFAFDEKNLLFC